MKKEFENAIKDTGHVLDQWLPIKIKYDSTPGMSVGIVADGKLLYSKSFGYADVEKKQKANEDTLYHIASISKTFTAMAVLQLVEEGKLHLDDKVSEYVDWFSGKEKHKDAENITIRDVITHTSGIFRDGTTSHWDAGKFPKMLKNAFSSESFVLENGTGFKYSNYGFSLLGLVIEKVSGMKYEAYISQKILKPLNMTRTVTDYSETLSNVAKEYGSIIPGEKRKVFSHNKTYAYKPATGFLSSVTDLAKYLPNFSLDTQDTLLSREMKKQMMHPYQSTIDDDFYGFGVDVISLKDRKLVGHGGGFIGSITQIFIEPKSGVGVIVLTNSLESSAPSIARATFEMIFDGVDNKAKHNGKLPDFKKYEGYYRDRGGDQIVTQFGKDLLTFSARVSTPLKHAVTLRPEKTSDTFRIQNDIVFGSCGELATFEVFKKGKPDLLFYGPTRLKRNKKKV